MDTPKRAFKIHGMDCAEEVATLSTKRARWSEARTVSQLYMPYFYYHKVT
jgi:hypothetical protein